MSKALTKLDELEQLTARLVAEVEQLRATKRELTEENASLREVASKAESAVEGLESERREVVARVDRIGRGLDRLLELAGDDS